MPFRTFSNWLFDGNINSEIPKPKKDANGKDIIPDILKYNSPITNQYVISIFLKNSILNHYLNRYLNNVGVWYLEKEDLFKFIKKCVIDFKVKKYDLVYYKRKKEDKLYQVMRERFPFLKNHDVRLFCKIVEASQERDAVYQKFNLEAPKKEKFRKNKKNKDKKISLESFLGENFSMMECQ